MFRLASVLFLCVLISKVKTNFIEVPSSSVIHSCAFDMFSKYMDCGITVTLVNFNTSDDELAKKLHQTECYKIISRHFHSFGKITEPNKAYVIIAQNLDALKKSLTHLTHDTYWNPNGRFLIISERITEDGIQELFNISLRYHLDNAVLLGSTEYYENEVFTYYPYENNSCGRRFNTIVRLGHCKQLEGNPFHNKNPRTLSGCSFKIVNHLSSPFTYGINHDYKGIIGIEEMMISTLMEKYKFNVEYIYMNTTKNYGKVLSNFSTTGLFKLMDCGDSNGADGLFGGVMLTENRMQIFDCITGYIMDRLLVNLPRALECQKWTFLYKAFSATTWSTIAFIYFSFLMLVFCVKIINRKCKKHRRIRRKLRTFTIVYDGLLNSSLSHNSVVHVAAVLWCSWVVLFLSGFYQTAMASVMTRPGYERQVDTWTEVVNAGYQLYVPHVLLPYLAQNENPRFLTIYRNSIDCEIFECLQIVASGNDINKFTILPDVHLGKAWSRIMDEKGEEKLHQMSIPYFTFTEAIYFRRGFPLLRELHLRTLQIVASGFINKCFREVTHRENLEIFYKREFKDDFDKLTFTDTIGSLIVLFIGYVFSIIIFIKELKYPGRIMK